MSIIEAYLLYKNPWVIWRSKSKTRIPRSVTWNPNKNLIENFNDLIVGDSIQMDMDHSMLVGVDVVDMLN